MLDYAKPAVVSKCSEIISQETAVAVAYLDGLGAFVESRSMSFNGSAVPVLVFRTE